MMALKFMKMLEATVFTLLLFPIVGWSSIDPISTLSSEDSYPGAVDEEPLVIQTRIDEPARENVPAYFAEHYVLEKKKELKGKKTED